MRNAQTRIVLATAVAFATQNDPPDRFAPQQAEGRSEGIGGRPGRV